MMVNLPCLMVSCTNFLRPTCSYTECWPSFRTGSCPTERTTVSYSSCLLLIVTDHLPPPRKLFFSGRSPLFQLLVLLVMQCSSHSISVYGFPIQNPARFQMYSDTRQGSGINNTGWFYATCADCCCGLTMSPDIFFGSYVVPFVRMAKITLSILQAITINDCIFFSGLSFRVV